MRLIFCILASGLAVMVSAEESIYRSSGSIRGKVETRFRREHPEKLAKCAGRATESGYDLVDSRGNSPIETGAGEAGKGQALLEFSPDVAGWNPTFRAGSLDWDTSMNDGRFSIKFSQNIEGAPLNDESSTECNNTSRSVKLNEVDTALAASAYIDVPKDVYVIELHAITPPEGKDDFTLCAAVHSYSGKNIEEVKAAKSQFKPTSVSGLAGFNFKTAGGAVNDSAANVCREEALRLSQGKGGVSFLYQPASGLSGSHYAFVKPGDRVFLHVVYTSAEKETRKWTFKTDVFMMGSEQCFRADNLKEGLPAILGPEAQFDPGVPALERMLASAKDTDDLAKKLGCLRHERVIDSILANNYGIDSAQYVRNLDLAFSQISRDRSAGPAAYLAALTLVDTGTQLLGEMTKFCQQTELSPSFAFDSDKAIRLRGYEAAAAEYKLYDAWIKRTSTEPLEKLIRDVLQTPEEQGESWYTFVEREAKTPAEIKLMSLLLRNAMSSQISFARKAIEGLGQLPKTRISEVKRGELMKKLEKLDAITTEIQTFRNDVDGKLRDLLAFFQSEVKPSAEEEENYRQAYAEKVYGTEKLQLLKDHAQLMKDIEERMKKDVEWYVPAENRSAATAQFATDLDELSTTTVRSFLKILEKEPGQTLVRKDANGIYYYRDNRQFDDVLYKSTINACLDKP